MQARTDNKDLKRSVQAATNKVQIIYQDNDEAIAAVPALFEAVCDLTLPNSLSRMLNKYYLSLVEKIQM
jgi:hypothetical protein